jgi:hypothetical protein
MIVGISKSMLETRSNMPEVTQFDLCNQYCYRATVTSSSWERNVSTHQLLQEPFQKKPAEDGKALDGKDQTILRSGIGKLMCYMQYLHPDNAQAVRYTARHMTRGDETHMSAMLRCMQYLTCTKEAGLLLKPTRKWDGTNKFQFKIRGRLDLNYAKDMQTRRSVSGYVVYLEEAPVMHRKSNAEDSCTVIV